jgi:hypothetical protein
MKAPFDLPASVVHQVSILGKEKKFPVFALRLLMVLEELLLRMGNSVVLSQPAWGFFVI